MNFNIAGIFPTPVFTVKLDTPISVSEKKLLSSFELRQNISNSSSINQYVLDHPGLKNLKEALSSCVNAYFQEVYKPVKHRDIQTYITSSWTNTTLDTESHPMHTHPNSFISGVLYISTTPGDLIQFCNPNMSYIKMWDIPTDGTSAGLNASHWNFPVEDNMIVLFPSWLNHAVPTRKNTNGSPRVSLAFNTFLKGHLGREDHATELKL